MKANEWLRYADVGLRLAVLCVLFVGAGVWADKRFHSSPLLTLAGVIAALALLLKTLLQLGKNDKSA